jgi:RNA ligase (TIGR02306 family)
VSTHKVEVVRLGPVVKHENADTLAITKIWAYTAIVRLGDFKEGDLVAYIEPDYVVPADDPQFAFLGKHTRIKAKRLRGVWSQGLVIKAPEGAKEGDDVMERLKIVRYVPKAPGHHAGGKGASGHSGHAERPHKTLTNVPTYDLENLRRHPHVFEPGEMVHVSEKIHGANARFAWRDGRMWAGSRTQWKRFPNTPPWWYRALLAIPFLARLWPGVRRLWRQIPVTWWTKVVLTTPWVTEWCKAHPDYILYGEVFGVQDLKYGVPENEVRFLAFDVMKADFTFVTPSEFEELIPQEYRAPSWMVPFDLAMLEEHSREDSKICPGQLAEGIVVKPLQERFHRNVGRVALKLVSDRYLERS